MKGWRGTSEGPFNYGRFNIESASSGCVDHNWAGPPTKARRVTSELARMGISGYIQARDVRQRYIFPASS